MNIKDLRRQKNMTQVEVAVKVGVSVVTVQLWEKGATTPSEENQKKLKELLHDVKTSE